MQFIIRVECITCLRTYLFPGNLVAAVIQSEFQAFSKVHGMSHSAGITLAGDGQFNATDGTVFASIFNRYSSLHQSLNGHFVVPEIWSAQSRSGDSRGFSQEGLRRSLMNPHSDVSGRAKSFRSFQTEIRQFIRTIRSVPFYASNRQVSKVKGAVTFQPQTFD